MRFVVLLFGFIAILITAAGGAVFLLSQKAIDWLIEQRDIAIPADVMSKLTDSVSLTNQTHGHTALFLFIAAAFGLFGTLLAFLRCGKQGGLLMLIPVLGAALMNPFSLIFTSLQAFTALMAFFVGPLPITAEED